MTKLCPFKDRVSLCVYFEYGDKAFHFHFWVKQLDCPWNAQSWPSDAPCWPLDASCWPQDASRRPPDATIWPPDALR